MYFCVIIILRVYYYYFCMLQAFQILPINSQVVIRFMMNNKKTFLRFSFLIKSIKLEVFLSQKIAATTSILILIKPVRNLSGSIYFLILYKQCKLRKIFNSHRVNF